MDTERFDGLTRIVASGISRRGLVAVAGLLGITLPGVVAAKKKRTRKRRKELKKNEFGCVNVGGTCRGKDAACCSGICRGKKPRKGKKDKSTCVAHNVGECQADQDACLEETVPCGTIGDCFQTTGRASFCGGFGVCDVCVKDTDCEADFGLGAACVVCEVSCQGTGGTACFEAAEIAQGRSIDGHRPL